MPGSNGDIGAYVAKVLPGGAAEQTGKIVEGKRLSKPFSVWVHWFCLSCRGVSIPRLAEGEKHIGSRFDVIF